MTLYINDDTLIENNLRDIKRSTKNNFLMLKEIEIHCLRYWKRFTIYMEQNTNYLRSHKYT